MFYTSAGYKEVTNHISPAAKQINLSFEFQEPTIIQDTEYMNKTFDRIITTDMHDYGDGPWGMPNIPYKVVRILLPQGETVEDVEVTVSDETEIIRDEAHPVLPVEHSSTIQPGYEYDPTVDFPYQMHDAFYSIVKEEGSRGYRILILRVYPIQYIQSQERLVYYRNVDIVIRTSPNGTIDPLFRNLTKDREWVASFVDNPDPEILDSYCKVVPSEPVSSLVDPQENYDYVIITIPRFFDSFQDFVQWKNNKGVKTTIVEVGDINNYYKKFGEDEQERIRAFIQDAYLHWGVEYVLLGADETTIYEIPVRKLEACVESNLYDVYEFLCSFENGIAADIYYSSLDGTWDTDEDGIFGEPGEEDLFSEVFIGRLPFNSYVEEYVISYTNKVIEYENSSPTQHKEILLAGSYLYGPDDEYPLLTRPHWGGDYIDNGIPLMPKEYDITKFYERELGRDNITSEHIIEELNEGVDFGISNGHGNEFFLETQDVDSLNNTQYFLAYAQSCQSAAFDFGYDITADVLLYSPHGAIGFIGYSDYGFSECDYHAGGIQDIYLNLLNSVFQDHETKLGKIVQRMREDTAGYLEVNGMDATRFNYYSLTLLGDPELTIQYRLADLTFTNLSFEPSEPQIGDGLSIIASFKNIGEVEAESGYSIKCEILKNDSVINTEILGEQPSLAPGQEELFNHSVKDEMGNEFTFNESGTYQVKFTIDSEEVIQETDEENNIVTDVFTVKRIPAPTLLRPINGTSTRRIVTFVWKGVEGAATYELQVSRYKDFRDIFYMNETENRYHRPQKLFRKGRWHWRVRAIAEGNKGEWGSSYFIVDPSPE